jgi:hypothetical protein
MPYAYDRQAGRWDNAANGMYFTLRWNKAKWRVEEMADGSPIPGSMGFGETVDLVSWEMPQLGALLSKFDTPVHAFPDSIKREARIQVEDKGLEVRRKLAAASNSWLQRASDELKADRSVYADKVESLVGAFAPKFVWKKVH